MYAMEGKSRTEVTALIGRVSLTLHGLRINSAAFGHR
jgi:hypothetical protein